ncbi:MAG: hypothetical protein ACOCQD_00470 [archaeon]
MDYIKHILKENIQQKYKKDETNSVIYNKNINEEDSLLKLVESNIVESMRQYLTKKTFIVEDDPQTITESISRVGNKTFTENQKEKFLNNFILPMLECAGVVTERFLNDYKLATPVSIIEFDLSKIIEQGYTTFPRSHQHQKDLESQQSPKSDPNLDKKMWDQDRDSHVAGGSGNVDEISDLIKEAFEFYGVSKKSERKKLLENAMKLKEKPLIVPFFEDVSYVLLSQKLPPELVTEDLASTLGAAATGVTSTYIWEFESNGLKNLDESERSNKEVEKIENISEFVQKMGAGCVTEDNQIKYQILSDKWNKFRLSKF